MFDEADPRPGHESTLEVIALASSSGRQRLGAPLPSICAGDLFGSAEEVTGR
ncbi:hypothetical protein [Micromonospora zamorensis]|uniref:hypothetical protein n=1 Tax=Micromonospora zamorensis TaxID=709883 RepID=UPI0018D54B79|nr:hypothetical protein [Micromonospora zamorensis]